jgi:hypothetical protein
VPLINGCVEPYEDFIRRAARNPIARLVKLADLEDNMDLSRIAQPTARDYARLKKYKAAGSTTHPCQEIVEAAAGRTSRHNSNAIKDSAMTNGQHVELRQLVSGDLRSASPTSI